MTKTISCKTCKSCFDNNKKTENNNTTVRWSFTELFADEIIDGLLNPSLLAVATAGHHIQSQILGIPHRWGFFSPGLPRLQVFEAQLSIIAFLLNCLTPMVLFTLSLLLGLPTGKTLGFLIGELVIPISLKFWSLAVYSPRRKPDYEWKDWKPQNDQVK